MGKDSKIEWTESTWNPIAGCSIVSTGCKNCYAMRMAARLDAMGQKKYAGTTRVVSGRAIWTGVINVDDGVMELPLRTRRPTTFFVNSMSDIFHKNLSFEVISEMFDVMCDERSQKHIFQILTKRPERIPLWINWMADSWSPESPASVALEVLGHFGENIWIGTSTENQETANKRIPELLKAPAYIRFISAEPMLGAIDMYKWLPDRYSGLAMFDAPYGITSPLDWVIVGGESGPNRRPMNLKWARDLRDQCKDAGVAFFFKQVDKVLPIPEDLMIREFPAPQVGGIEWHH
jgi:protein gp37